MLKRNLLLVWLLAVGVSFLYGTKVAAVDFVPTWNDVQLDVRTMSDWSIVLPDEALASERYAAEELQTFFGQATGFTLDILEQAESNRKNIYLGRSASLRLSGLAQSCDEEYAGEELHILTAQDNIAILGGRPRGVLYGVYDFLEYVLGVRFLTADHIYVPKFREDDTFLRVAQNKPGIIFKIDYRYNPPMDYRLVYYWEALWDIEFGRRIRSNATDENYISKVPADVVAKVGGWSDAMVMLHNVKSWLDESPNVHPEYYATIPGGNPLYQVCMSHPEVIEKITATVMRHLPEKKDALIRIVREDGPGCACERCTAIANRHGGAYSAAMLELVNHVARTVGKVRPDLWIGTVAYGFSAQPPENLKIEPNVRIQLATYHACMLHSFAELGCPINLEQVKLIEGWSKLVNSMTYWTYAMNSRDYLMPPPIIDNMGANLRFLRDNDGHGVFIQGSGGGKGAALCDLMIYLTSRLQWNPDLEAKVLINEFLDLHYGRQAAVPIRAFLDQVSIAERNSPAHTNCNALFQDFGFSEEMGARGIELFNEALDLAETDQQRSRIRKASITAYRLTLGNLTYGKASDAETPGSYRHYVQIADRLKALCEEFDVRQHGEGWPIQGLWEKLDEGLKVMKKP